MEQVVRRKPNSHCVAMYFLAGHETGHMTVRRFSASAGHHCIAPLHFHWWPKYGNILVSLASGHRLIEPTLSMASNHVCDCESFRRAVERRCRWTAASARAVERIASTLFEVLAVSSLVQCVAQPDGATMLTAEHFVETQQHPTSWLQ